jgi:phosphoglycerate kinase
MIRSLQKVNIEQKRVLLRLDFDLPLENYLLTFNYLLEHSPRLIVILGSSADHQLDFQGVAKKIGKLLNQSVQFWPESFQGQALADRFKKENPQGILLLGNLRNCKEEIDNEPSFGEKLAEFGNLYVNEAFSLSHHNWASLVQTPKFIPRAAGQHFFKESVMLTLKKSAPVAVISGGVDLLSSLEFITRSLERKYDVLVGGKIADVILRVKGHCPGKAWPSEEIVRLINSLELTNTNLHLPLDAVVAPDYSEETYTRISALGKIRMEEDVLDIGPSTVELFKKVIKEAQTVIWHGPLGFYENPTFNHGTKKIASAIVENENSYKLVGGEETINCLKSFGLEEKMSFLSTNSRAMMALVVGEKLPAIEVLQTKLKSTDGRRKNKKS